MTKLVVLYKSRSNRESVREHFDNVHLPLLGDLPGLQALLHGYEINSTDGAIYAAVVECTIEDWASLTSALASPAGMAVRQDAKVHFGSDVTIITYSAQNQSGLRRRYQSGGACGQP